MQYNEAMHASMSAVRNNQTNQAFYSNMQAIYQGQPNNLNAYEIKLLETIQNLYYKKYEIDNYLNCLQIQFSQSRAMPLQSSNNNNDNNYSFNSHTQIIQSTDPSVISQCEISEEKDVILQVEEFNNENKDCNDSNGETDEIKSQVSFKCDETINEIKPTFANIVMKNLPPVNIKTSNDFSVLFKKLCHSCNLQSPNRSCKYIHANDENYFFYSLPLNKRCLRSVCFDLSCLRVHHSLTQRLSVKCDKSPCSCNHYVHPNDTFNDKPYFWKPYDESIEKPSQDICKEYFLLKPKFKKVL